MGFDLSAFGDVEAALEKEADVLQHLAGDDAAKGALKSALDLIAQDAKARVHSITGNLVKGIKSKVEGGKGEKGVSGWVGVPYAKPAKAHHAHLVEGGHGGPHGPAAPHPFWAPAVEATKDEALDALASAVEDKIADLWS